MREEIIATRSIFSGRIVNLKLHTVQLPDGNHGQREIIYHQGAVAIVALDASQHVLLVKQYRLAIDQITYEIPAGLLEPDEAPDEAISRELREETGYRPLGVQALGGVYVAPGYTTEYIHLYTTRGYEYAPLSPDADEFVEALRIPFTKALAMIEQGEIVEAKSVVGLLRVARHLGI
ncbi:MAG: NUDIX hydrolase [Anaerolineae bacterium]